MSKEKTSVFVMIAFVVFLSAFLLSFELESKSLWADELFSLKAGEKLLISFEEFDNFLDADVHPPLYFYLLGRWMSVAGKGDASIRFFSVICSLLTLCFSYLFAGKCFDGRIPLISTLLISVSPFFILYSRMARYYSFTAMLFCLSCFFFLKITRNENSVFSSIMYLLSSCFMILSFYPSVFAVAGQNVFYFLFYKKRNEGWKIWVCGQTLLLASVFPFFLKAIEQSKRFKTDITADFSSSMLGVIASVGDLFYEFSAGGTVFAWEIAGFLLFAFNCFFFFFGIKKMFSGKSQEFFFLISVFSISLLGMLAVFNFVATEHSFVFFASRCFFIYPVFVFIIACGLDSLKRRGMMIVFIILLADFIPLNNYFSGKSFLNPVYDVPSREVAESICTRYGEEESIVISPSDTLIPEYMSRISDQSHLYLYKERENALKYAASQAPKFVTVIYFGRDRTKELFSDNPAEKLSAMGYFLYDEKKFSKIDPLYLKLKEYLLKRKCYRYKLVVRTFKKAQYPKNENSSYL